MKSTLSLLLVLLVIPVLFAAEGSDSPKTTILFDRKSTTGWHQAGPGGFDLKDNTLISHGGMGLFWHEKEFSDCVLTLEYKVNQERCNSGVFVRFPDPHGDPWDAVKNGQEIQILGKTTGDVYKTKKNTGAQPKPPGEWNTMEVKLVGQHYTIKLNDKIINEFNDTGRPTRGHVGIQNHDPNSIVTFRNIKVEELTPASSQPTPKQ